MRSQLSACKRALEQGGAALTHVGLQTIHSLYAKYVQQKRHEGVKILNQCVVWIEYEAATSANVSGHP